MTLFQTKRQWGWLFFIVMIITTLIMIQSKDTAAEFCPGSLFA